MAKIQEEIIVIKCSQLVKDGDEAGSCITEEVITALVQVAEELLCAGIVVEIEKA